MSRVGFEPIIQVFELTKTVHALDRAGTVIGIGFKYDIETRRTLQVTFRGAVIRDVYMTRRVNTEPRKQ
jgi:hypothetical protein